MAAIQYRELKRRYELDGPARTTAHLTEALRAKQLRAEDFSIRDLAEALIPDGHHWVRSLDPRAGGTTSVLEASEGVDVTAFLNVTGQLIYSKILDAYQREAFVASKLVQTIPTRLDGEKIPGVTRPVDRAMEVHPGMPYPEVGFGEDYIETPSTTKHGLIVSVTREAIFFDRTNLVLSRAAEVGEILGLNKEKRILDVVLGVTNNYNWKGSSQDTYQAAGDSGPWINELAANALVDWTDVDAAEQLFAAMTDPATGEPVLVEPNQVLVMPASRFTAYRIFSASAVTYSTSDATMETSSNPLSHYQVHVSRLAHARLVAGGETSEAADEYWYLGDFQRAFAYMENWPITVTQSNAGSDADFNQDILVRFKASERGAAAVLNPRYVVRCTG